MASPIRQKKVEERIREDVGEILQHDMKDPRIGMVSVVKVKISADLRLAKIYVSVMGEKTEKTLTMAALKNARGFIQSRLAKGLNLRFAPSISFLLDESIEKSIKVTKIIDELAAEMKKKEEPSPALEEEEDEEEESGEEADPHLNEA